MKKEYGCYVLNIYKSIWFRVVPKKFDISDADRYDDKQTKANAREVLILN